MSHHHRFEDHCRPEPHHEQHHNSVSINFDFSDRNNHSSFHNNERHGSHPRYEPPCLPHYEPRHTYQPHAYQPHHTYQPHCLPSVVIVLGHERHSAPPIFRHERPPVYRQPNPILIDGCFDYGAPLRRSAQPELGYSRPVGRGSDFFVANPNTGYDTEDFAERPQLRETESLRLREDQKEVQRNAQLEAIYNDQWGPEGSAGYDPSDNAPRAQVGPFEARPAEVQARPEEIEARRKEAELNDQWGPEGSAGYDPREVTRPEEQERPQSYSEYTAAMARYIAEHVPMSPVDNF